jgi:hypothetical protein
MSNHSPAAVATTTKNTTGVARGVREALDKHKTAAVASAVVALLAMAVFAWRSTSLPAGAAAAEAAQSFYSTDDGATFFPAAADLIPPVQVNGKTACRAIVFTCDGGKTKFVGYLERYSPAAKAQLEAARDAMKRGDKNAAPAGPAAGDVEVKKPGGGNRWVSRRGPAAADDLKVTPPPGSSGGAPEMVTQ